MKPRFVLPVLTLALVTLSGCAAAADLPEPSPTPTIDPGPVELSIDAAGERYLQIICPNNAAGEALNQAFLAGEDEFMNGGAPDPAAVKAAGVAALDVGRATAEFLDDEYYIWPEDVAEHIATIRTITITDLSYLSEVANATTFEQAYYATYVNDGSGATASQTIRFELGLDPDTTASCIGYESGHEELRQEQTEREAELAKFDL